MVWSELDLQALLLKNRVRTPGDGLLRPMKLKQIRPAERNHYVAEMAKRYKTTVPRRSAPSDLEHLVDPTGVIAVAAAHTGTHVVGHQPSGHSSPMRRNGGGARKPQHRAAGGHHQTSSQQNFPSLSASQSGTVATDLLYPSLGSASTSVTAVSLPRLPKGKSTTFRASVRTEILKGHHIGPEALRKMGLTA